MKKSTKGAIAAAGAAVLLLGGAGSLAYWTATGSADGGTIASGSITLSSVTCGADWTEGSDVITLLVPGDTVTKQCTGTLTLTGEHIGATVALDSSSLATAETAFNNELTVDAAMSSPAATITEPGTYDVTIDITAAFEGAAATNASQGVPATSLGSLKLTATQTHDTAANS